MPESLTKYGLWASHQTQPLGQFGTLPTLGPPEGGPEGHSTGGPLFMSVDQAGHPKGTPCRGALPAKCLPGERLIRTSCLANHGATGLSVALSEPME